MLQSGSRGCLQGLFREEEAVGERRGGPGVEGSEPRARDLEGAAAEAQADEGEARGEVEVALAVVRSGFGEQRRRRKKRKRRRERRKKPAAPSGAPPLLGSSS